MKLSDYILEKKKEGLSRSGALTATKAVVKKSGGTWTVGREKLFNEIWVKPAHVPVSEPPRQATHSPLRHPDPEVQESTELHRIRAMFSTLEANCSLKEAATHVFIPLWKYYNHLYFQSKMTQGPFLFLKDTGIAFRTRAHYRPATNALSFSRRFFNIDFTKFCGTFIHEMCHQAVYLVDAGQGSRKASGQRDIHGEAWSKWMRHCGQDPSRCDHTDNIEYLNAEERAEVEARLAARSARGSDKKKVTNPVEGTVVQVYDEQANEWITGAIAFQKDAKKQLYAVADKLRASSFRIASLRSMYHVSDEVSSRFNTDEWRRYLDYIKTAYTRMVRDKKQLNLAKKVVDGKVKQGLGYFDVQIIPPHRRHSYIVIVYILTKTKAKNGNGSYSLAELTKVYSTEDVIDALNWMIQVDGGWHVSFSTTSGLNSLVLTRPDYEEKYDLAYFQSNLYDYYKPDEDDED